MSLDKERAFKLLEKISFERIAGTDKELECAHILEEECKKASVDVAIEDFLIDDPEVFKAELKVVEPTECNINCVGIGKSGNTSDEGITAPLSYVENGLDANLVDVKGKIVLLTGGKPEVIEKLKKAGAVGYIQIFGSLFDPIEMVSEIRPRNIRNNSDKLGNFPGVLIHITDAQKLLRMHPEKVTLVLKQDENKKSTSHNVIATIEGSSLKEEVITFTAHFDSVIYSKGAWDNGTGSVTIMELMHYFNANKPNRTLKFIWCGSEEIGLEGSKAYCEAHKDELDKVLFNINVDMTGTLLGFDVAVCSCEESLAKYIDVLGKIEGFPVETHVDMYSSDSSSFVLSGIPAVTFARLAPRGGAEIHSRKDIIDHLDKDKFIETVEFMATFSEKIVNAKVFPVSKEFPKSLTEKIDEYKRRFEKTKKDEKEDQKEK